MLFCRSQATKEKRKKSVDEDEDEDMPVAKKPIKVRRCNRTSSRQLLILSVLDASPEASSGNRETSRPPPWRSNLLRRTAQR
jgi:hypothetical protein